LGLTEQKKFTACAVLERFGISGHMGGIYATQRLIKLCNVASGECLLDIGCGTGYTACLLAKNSVDVVVVDITSKVLEGAKERATEEGVGDKVTTIRADARNPPFLSQKVHLVFFKQSHAKMYQKVLTRAFVAFPEGDQ